MDYIVLVNWNGFRDTIPCLESLLRLPQGDFRVLVCDNGSIDGSIDHFVRWADGRESWVPDDPLWNRLPPQRTHTPQLKVVGPPVGYSELAFITVVAIGTNLGFAGANNVGAKIALSDPAAERIWFLNNDTVVDPEALAALRQRCKEDPRIGICGATLIYASDGETVQGVGVRFDVATGMSTFYGFGGSRRELPDRDEVERNLTYVIGASMYVSREFLETVGPMSERYFLYFEELDWSLRNNGRYRLAWAPGAVVYHKEGGTIGTSMTALPSKQAVYYQSVNHLRVVWQYRQHLIAVTLLRQGFNAVRFFVRGYRKGATTTLRAVWDFMIGRYRRGPIT